jgi:phage baseplate assembly protein W
VADKTVEDIQRERDALKPNTKRVYFFDINKDGVIQPKTKNAEGKSDLGRLTNEEAVLESIFNILMTEPGEKAMSPLFGCSLNKYEFEPIDNVTALRMVESVETAIALFEPRLLNFNVIVTPDPDNNTMIIDVFIVVNTKEETVRLSTTLEKIR